MTRVPVTVLTGFLGSGKTTLLAAMLRRAEFAQTAVVMNEFGEAGLDHHLIETSEEDLIALSTGCLCCAARGDLARAIGGLLGRRRAGEIAFQRIVVETTGMADPAPILQAFMLDPALAEGVELARVVTTADALAGSATLDARFEARRQAAFADVLIVTKGDLAGAGAADRLAARLARLNGAARIVHAANGAADPALLLPGPAAPRAWTPPLDLRRSHDHAHEHGGVGAVTLRRAAPVAAAALPLFFEALAEIYGAKLLRVKGLIQVAEAPERPGVVHGVQHVFHPLAWLDRWPEGETGTCLTLIGEGLSPDLMTALLDMLDEEARAAAG